MKGLFTKVLAGLRGTTEVVQFVQARMSGDWCCVTTRVVQGQGEGWQWHPEREPWSQPVDRDSDLWSASRKQPGKYPTSLSSLPPISS